jgi:hypothetical protein
MNWEEIKAMTEGNRNCGDFFGWTAGGWRLFILPGWSFLCSLSGTTDLWRLLVLCAATQPERRAPGMKGGQKKAASTNPAASCLLRACPWHASSQPTATGKAVAWAAVVSTLAGLILA